MFFSTRAVRYDEGCLPFWHSKCSTIPLHVLQAGPAAGELGYERAAVQPRISVSDPAYSVAEVKFADEPLLDGELLSAHDAGARNEAGSRAKDGAAAGAVSGKA